MSSRVITKPVSRTEHLATVVFTEPDKTEFTFGPVQIASTDEAIMAFCMKAKAALMKWRESRNNEDITSRVKQTLDNIMSR